MNSPNPQDPGFIDFFAREQELPTEETGSSSGANDNDDIVPFPLQPSSSAARPPFQADNPCPSPSGLLPKTIRKVPIPKDLRRIVPIRGFKIEDRAGKRASLKIRRFSKRNQY